MIEAILSLLAVMFGIIGVLFKKRYSSQGIKERDDHERDKEIAEKDHISKSKRLSDLVDAVKLRNAKKKDNSTT